MFAVRSYARASAISIPRSCLTPRLLRRGAATRDKIPKGAENIIQTPLAEKLIETKIWPIPTRKLEPGDGATQSRKRKKKKPPVKGDKSRVNIVEEKLCDDVLSYLKPSLKRHIGCDIVDLYPGAGLWSRKLNEALQPRSHILMEPDADLYRPFLEPLLSKPGTKLVPESGIVWTNLSKILSPTYLPQQVPRKSDTPERNDTLLLVANLCFYPKRSYMGFASVSQLVLFQLINSIRTSTLFQKYGLVRMLLWLPEIEKVTLLPRSVQRRSRVAVDGEMSTEWIVEVCGPDKSGLAVDLGEKTKVTDEEKETGKEVGGEVETGARAKLDLYQRDFTLDIESARMTLARMRAAGVQIPAGRETELMKQVIGAEARGEKLPQVNEGPAWFSRTWRSELARLKELEARGNLGNGTAVRDRFRALRFREGWDERRQQRIFEKMTELDTLNSLRQAQLTRASGVDCKVKAYKTETASEQDLDTREREWNAGVDQMPLPLRQDFLLGRDNLRLFRQEPPVLLWDRRPMEPMVVQEREFFPNVPCSLLDIQPKAMHPLLRQIGPGSSRAGEHFELLQSAFFRSRGLPIDKSLASLWHGASEGVLPHCLSLRDPTKGGSLVGGNGSISCRTLNETQWTEILEAWMKWPFKPELTEFAASDGDDESHEPEYGD